MGRYKVVLRKSVSRDLRGIPKKDAKRIVSVIRALAVDPRPHCVKKLSGKERYRIRKGDYRILYSIEDDLLIVTVVRVGNRSDVCR